MYFIHSLLLQLSYIRHIFDTFHPSPSLHIYIVRAEYCPIPHDAVDWRKIGLNFFKKNSILGLTRTVLYFLIMLLKDNMNQLYLLFSETNF